MVVKPSVYDSSQGLFISRLIQTSDIEDNAITSAKIASGAVGTSELAASAVDTINIKDGAVTYPKLNVSGKIKETDLEPGISIDISEIVKQPSLTAAEDIATGACVYITTNGEVGVADPTDINKMPAIGVAYGSASSGANIDVVLRGRHIGYDFSGYVGQEVFVGNSGLLVTTPPSSSGNIQQKMGVVYSANGVLVNPSTELIQIA